MKKVAKVFLIVGLALTLGGAILGAVGLVWHSAEVDAGMYDGKYITRQGTTFKLRSVVDEDRKVEEPYQSLYMSVDIFQVTVLPSEDGTTHVHAKNVPEGFLNLEVHDGTLVLSQNSTDWGPFSMDGFFTSLYDLKPEITLYLPEQQLEDVTLWASTSDILWKTSMFADSVNLDIGVGDMEIQELRAEDARLNSSAGNLLVSGGEVRKLHAIGESGTMDLRALHVDEAVFDAGVGDIQITDCEFDRLEYDGDIGRTQMENVSVQTMADIRADIGDFEGRNVSLNNAKIEASVGQLTLEGELLGECSVKQDIGDVHLTLAKDVPLAVNVASVDLGQIRVEGSNGGETIYGDGLPMTVNGGFLNDSQAENSLTVRGGIGNMRIEFK